MNKQEFLSGMPFFVMGETAVFKYDGRQLLKAPLAKIDGEYQFQQYCLVGDISDHSFDAKMIFFSRPVVNVILLNKCLTKGL